ARCDYQINLEKAEMLQPSVEFTAQTVLSKNTPYTQQRHITIPENMPYSQPYWLAEIPQAGVYTVEDQALIGQPQLPSWLQMRFVFTIDGTEIPYTKPVQYKWLDQRDGEKFGDVVVVPPVTVQFDEKVHVFSTADPAEIRVTVKSNVAQATGEVKLVAPAKWQVSSGQKFDLAAKYAEQSFLFTVQPPHAADIATISAIAFFQGQQYNRTQITIDYEHIPVQTVLQAAELKNVRVPLERRKKLLGYIAGAGDEIPANLRSIGYEVTMLSETDLEKTDLSQFDAIIAGVRVYNTRPELKQKNTRLMDYVKNGGTYVVQYNTSYALVTEAIGPYPITLSHDRITLEDAPMAFLDKEHPVFNRPNKITSEDFSGWVQERGLYFPNKWDTHYQPLLAGNDPGEAPTKGSLLYSAYGKGVFIYTGLSFFRELPAGVPGAYRLFVNLIEAAK
ncbi:hypothetical protein KC799_13205, partial [candidate division KSB1 bacterium]|nr:hypothetical protein [candidate division KSB1 bacterium]